MNSFKTLNNFCIIFLILALIFSFSGCSLQSSSLFNQFESNATNGNMMEVRKDDMTYTDQEVSLANATQNISNYRQFNASVGLFAENEEMYFVFYGGDNSPKNMGRLGVLRNGQAQFFSELQKNYSKMVVWEGAAYYNWHKNGVSGSILYRFNLQNGKTEEVLNKGFSINSAPHFCVGCDGTLYYVDDQELATGYPILDGTTGELTEIPGTIELGDSSYSGNWVWGSSLIKTDPDETMTEVSLGEGESWYLPYKDGLLAMNLTKGNTLHYIDENGTIVELFSNECDYGELAVNSWGEYIFVSIQRYERYKENALPHPYENDTESGTYRINMENLNVVKISDHAYNGLYIFSEDTIYACDSMSNVHQLDFSGAIIMEVISS